MTTTPRRGSPSTALRPRPRRRPRFALLAVAATCLVALIGTTSAGAAQSPVGLGTATSFAILAGAGITNTGATTITGDVGTYPTTSRTGFDTVTLTGVDHGGDAVTQQAKLDLVDAYDDAAGRGPVTAATPVDLAGRTLAPGVYSNGTIELSGALTLDAEGDPDAVFVFQAASTLVTAAASTVTVINGGPTTACNIFWQVGSSATLGSGSTFVGSVLAAESISLDSTATVEGRLLARTGAVTLINNTITTPQCAAIAPTPTPTTTAPSTTSPSIDDGAAPAGPDDGGSATPGRSPSGPGAPGPGGPGSPGAPPDGSGTPVGSTAPPGAAPPTSLAFTGTDPRVVLVGIAALLAGLMCLTLAPVRRRSGA